MKKSTWLMAAAAALVVSAFAAWGAPQSSPATVGDFALKISRGIGQQPADEAAAAAALRKSGVDLGTDLRAVVTAGRAAGILRDLGVPVAAAPNPDASLSLNQVDQIVKGVAVTRGLATTPFRPGQGNCPVSPSSPGDCDDQGQDQGNQGGHH